MCKQKKLTDKEKRYQDVNNRKTFAIAGFILIMISILGIVVSSIIFSKHHKNTNLSSKGSIVNVV